MDNYVPGSSRKARTARTLLLRMAADDARAERIRQMKRDHPELTWQAIADRVGVTLRAAQSWQEKGAISYANAKKLAEVLGEDVDFVMRGPRSETPDLLGVEVDERFARLEERLVGLIEQQNRLLARQSQILERIEARVAREENVRREVDASAEALLEASRRALQVFEAGSEEPAVAARTPARS